MANALFIQFLALSIYAFFVGFCFCDGFGLHIVRKFSWFITFLIVSVAVLKIKNEFALALILPIPTLLAIVLCVYEKKKSRSKS